MRDVPKSLRHALMRALVVLLAIGLAAVGIDADWGSSDWPRFGRRKVVHAGETYDTPSTTDSANG